jgi:hypothetical protein
MMIEFCQPAVLRLLETTYFGMEFIRSAKPSSVGAIGQNKAKIS